MLYNNLNYLSPLKTRQTWLLLGVFLFVIECTAQQNVINDSAYKITETSFNFNPGKPINLTAFKFYKPPGNRINFGFAGNQYQYILLKLSAAGLIQNKCLCIDNTSLDTISVYKILPDGSSRLMYQGGNLIAFDDNKSCVWHTAPVTINSTPSFYLVALKAAEKNINVQYQVIDTDVLQKNYQSYDRVVFFYIGVICVITLIILTAFMLYKQKVFAAYLGYIICFSGWVLSHYGRLFPMFYAHTPVINEIAKPFTSLGAGLFLIIVLQLVFKQHLQYYPMLKKIITCMIDGLPLFIYR